MISYGPCQFPTLGFVVERQRKIDMFRPQNWWGMQLKIEVGLANGPARQPASQPPNNATFPDAHPTTSPLLHHYYTIGPFSVQVAADGVWQDQAMVANFTWQRGRVYDHISCLAMYQMCLEEPGGTAAEGRDGGGRQETLTCWLGGVEGDVCSGIRRVELLLALVPAP